jgi:hypothetical protein
MKKILLTFCCLFLSISARSLPLEDPSNFCEQSGACTPRMQEISNGYKSGNIEFIQSDLVGYSGGCFHISPSYHPDHKHYGAFVFKIVAGDVITTGIFDFFPEKDPYENMTSVELDNWFLKIGSRYIPVIQNTEHVELQYTSDVADLHYWFRSNSDQSKIFMIARQAQSEYLGFIYCEMNRR